MTVDGSVSGDGLTVLKGDSLIWRYTVTNTGDKPLSDVSVSDSEAGVTPAYVSGDTNGNDMLDLTETWVFEATGGEAIQGLLNTGTVTATGTGADPATHSKTVTATDTSDYTGYDPAIAITKVTVDGSVRGRADVHRRLVDHWRYTVTNTGDKPLSDVSVSDSEAGVTPAYVSGDTNGNGMLDLTETWVFEATGTAICGSTATPAPRVLGAETPQATCAPPQLPTPRATSALTRRSNSRSPVSGSTAIVTASRPSETPLPTRSSSRTRAMSR